MSDLRRVVGIGEASRRSGRGVWRSFVLVQSTVDFVCPRRVPFPRLFWDAIPDPTGLMFTGSPEEVDDLVGWLELQREGESDEMLIGELDFAIEQVCAFVEHNVAPPPSSWGDAGSSFF